MTYPPIPPAQTIESSPEYARHRRRRLWIAVSIGVLGLLTCLVGVGAWLRAELTPQYPDAAPEPLGSTHVRTSMGYDTSDPLVYTASVVDVPEGEQSLYSFYTSSYAVSDGWTVQQATPNGSLCLVNTRDPGVVRALEARPFAGAPAERRANRFLVISSEFNATVWESDGICGRVNGWLECEIEVWELESSDGTAIPCYDPRIEGGLD